MAAKAVTASRLPTSPLVVAALPPMMAGPDMGAAVDLQRAEGAAERRVMR
jgi:hypothetical protein